MGYSVWLVPVEAQRLAIGEIMAVRPAHSQPTSRCYPHIDPHVTIALFDCDNELDPALFEDLKALATDIAPITTTFAAVKFGKTYFSAAKVVLNRTAELKGLRSRVLEILRGHKINDRCKSFPQLPLFNVEEQAERTRLIKQLVEENHIAQVPGSDEYVLTASSRRDGPLNRFDGSEIWLVDCRGRVAKWQRIGAPIPLCKPPSPTDHASVPVRRNQQSTAGPGRTVRPSSLDSPHQPLMQTKSRMIAKPHVQATDSDKPTTGKDALQPSTGPLMRGAKPLKSQAKRTAHLETELTRVRDDKLRIESELAQTRKELQRSKQQADDEINKLTTEINAARCREEALNIWTEAADAERRLQEFTANVANQAPFDMVIAPLTRSAISVHDDETFSTISKAQTRIRHGEDDEMAVSRGDDGTSPGLTQQERRFSVLTLDSGTVFDSDDWAHVAAKEAYYCDDDAASVSTFNSHML